MVGRTREIEEVLDVLGKRRTNNPCLVGEPGVGKTAVVEGVAQRLLSAPRARWGKTIVVELSTADLVAGTSLRGSFSERLNGLKEEMRRAAGRVVVFIDEIHTLVGAGSTGEGAQDAANELKARAGPRRVPLHRRHHPRRVPALHLEPTRRWSGASPRWWSASRPCRRRWRS